MASIQGFFKYEKQSDIILFFSRLSIVKVEFECKQFAFRLGCKKKINTTEYRIILSNNNKHLDI